MPLPLEESLPLAGIIRDRLHSIQRVQPELGLTDRDLSHIANCAALCEATLANGRELTDLRQRANGAYRGKTAELFSAEVRSRFGFDEIEPLFSLVDRALSRGCVILGSPAAVSVAVVFDGLNAIFVGSHLTSTSLYEVACCLGHTLTLSPADEPVVEVLPSTHSRKHGRAAFARRFAGHFLLPAGALGIALLQIRRILRRSQDGIADVELFYLSRVFGTPFETAAQRCEDESLIPRGSTRALIRYLQREAGGVAEREAALALPERAKVEMPLIPPEVVVQGLRDATVSESVREICLTIGLEEGELEQLESVVNDR